MKEFLIFALSYFCIISLVTCIITYIDKKKAIKHKFRIPESTLILFGFLGGALAEYLTMKKIHHKTLHKKFMIGLPAIMILHLIIVGAALYLYFR